MAKTRKPKPLTEEQLKQHWLLAEKEEVIIAMLRQLIVRVEAIEAVADLEGKVAKRRKADRQQAKAGAFVYGIQSVDGGPIKIGWAIDPSSRLAELQIASYARLSLVLMMGTGRHNAHQVEQRAHYLLRDKRLSGEWFDVAPQQASEAVMSAINSIDQEAPFWHLAHAPGGPDDELDDIREHFRPELGESPLTLSHSASQPPRAKLEK